MSSSVRYLGIAVGFGFGVVWMTVGVGSAILVLLCAGLGLGMAVIAERERAGLSTLRRSKQQTIDVDESLIVDDFELDHFERHDEQPATDGERAPVLAEADYGWPGS